MGHALRNRKTVRLNADAPEYTRKLREKRGPALSQLDDIRHANDKPRENTAKEKRSAKLRIATWAATTDTPAEACRELLDMLGLGTTHMPRSATWRKVREWRKAHLMKRDDGGWRSECGRRISGENHTVQAAGTTDERCYACELAEPHRWMEIAEWGRAHLVTRTPGGWTAVCGTTINGDRRLYAATDYTPRCRTCAKQDQEAGRG